MDYGFSPSRQGCTMHMPSPTHPHSYRLDGAHFSHLQQLRRSLSRSPSKPSRFQLRTSDSTRSPISPLALARAFSPKVSRPSNSTAPIPESPPAAQAGPTKKKFSLRRSAPFRSSPRARNSGSKSPRRRVLAESTDVGNSTPLTKLHAFGEENTPVRRLSIGSPDTMDIDKDFVINDKPIKFGFARRHDLSPARTAKSSPRKRSDALMSTSGEPGTSPVAKRRSLHGAASLGNDFESIFDQPTSSRAVEEMPRIFNDNTSILSFSSPVSTQSPLRRPSSLRKSTLSQRVTTPRAKPTYDGDFAFPGPAASKTRNRMSLDSSLGMNSTPNQNLFKKSTFDNGRMGPPQPSFRTSTGVAQPHPLSYAHTPSSASSSPSLHGETPMAPPRAPPSRPAFCAPPTNNNGQNYLFTRSLPIGIGRPHASESSESHQELFGTPFKINHPPPVAFSTGLLSKRNRNVDEPASGESLYIMPDTPSKRQSFPPAVIDNLDTPMVRRTGSLFGNSVSGQPFDTPSKPFSTSVSKFSTDAFARSSIFNNSASRQRRGSFLSIGEGDDDAQLDNRSPTANRTTESQASADDLPPTPTKPGGGSSRRSKGSSLRRKTFRQRPSLGTDTFAAPEVAESHASIELFSAPPRTPNEPLGTFDASRLLLSDDRRGSVPFNSSLTSLLPATPTTPRDSSCFFSSVQGAIPIGLTKNDVDESMSARFHEVRLLDGREGEFSEVYRVGKPVQPSPGRSPAGSQTWIIKKTKKPYTGAGDRARKLREVEVLQALRGNEHVLNMKTYWEFNSHLYIQTEYCEGGNLRKYLDTVGFNSRLDDFRIWKILLEMLMGLHFIHESGYIHLDLKPANILIDFEGGLKIADFGLASPWPAPAHIDGEGDRHYLAPEALSGRFDKPADVFALGMMLAEIAGNCVIPENGVHWQKLRSGEFDNILPSLTWSADSSTLSRNSHGDPILENPRRSLDGFLMSDVDLDALPAMEIQSKFNPEEELARAPGFMVDRHDLNSMDNVVHAMLNQDPDLRPTSLQVLQCYGCQWVNHRRRAGATIYEGNFGPSDEILSTYIIPHHDGDTEMMDMS